VEGPGPAARLRILENDLQRRLGQLTELHCAVRYALGEFGRNPYAAGIPEVARDSGLSRRRFS
jgi:hypothetical protein